MRNIWCRRIFSGALLASAAALAIWWRFRSRLKSRFDWPVPPTPAPVPVTAPSPTISSAPVVDLRPVETGRASSIASRFSTPWSAALWFAAAIAVCLAAALAMSSTQAIEFHDWASMFIVAAAGLALGAIVVVRQLHRDRARVWPLWLWRFIGVFAAIIVAFIAADINFYAADFEPEKQLTSTLLWVLAVIVAVGAVWPRREARAAREEPLARQEVFALIGIITLAFALRVIDLDHLPRMLSGDETKYGLVAEYLTGHQVTKPFITGADGHWNLYFMITGVFIQMFGATVAALRLPSVIAGTLSIVATYAVVRQLWGRRPAFIAAALLTTFHHHLHFSRIGVNSIDDPLFSMLVFGCLWLAWRTGRRSAWLMMALAAGLSQYFFVGGRLVLIQAAVMGVFWLITNPRRVRAQALNIALAIGVFICIVTPIAYFIVKSPDDYLGSLNNKNIYRSGWVQAQMQATGQSEGEVLLGQFRAVITSFSITSDEAFYWRQAILTPAMSGLAALALLYFIRRIREESYFWLVSALTLLIVLGGILIVSPTAGSHRLLGSGPLIYGAIAVLLDRVLSRLERWRLRPRWVAAIGTVVVAALMIGDASYYVVGYIDGNELYSPEVRLDVVHRYVIGLDARYPGPLELVCVGLNSDYCGGTNLQYLVPQLLARAEVLTDITSAADVPPPDHRPQIVIVTVELADEIQHMQQRYPTVEAQAHDGPRGELEFTSFEVPPTR